MWLVYLSPLSTFLTTATFYSKRGFCSDTRYKLEEEVYGIKCNLISLKPHEVLMRDYECK